MSPLRSCALLMAALPLACARPPGPASALDPVTSDPTVADVAFPAALEALAVPSGSARMNGIVYVAAGPGPHPVAILLHGFPGDERNGDLAQALRRAGYDVLFFHYRGAWGSEGAFSFSNALEDVAAALALVRSDAFARRFRADPARVVLVGHSMGGFLALAAASEDPGVACVASLAGANLGLLGAGAAQDPALRRRTEQQLDTWGRGPIRGTSGRELVAEVIDNAARFDTAGRAAQLADRPVLLVAGLRDTVTPLPLHHAPLLAALEAAGASHARAVELDSDHAFSDRRLALAGTLVEWLASECR